MQPNIYVYWSTSELRVRLARRKTGLIPPVNLFYSKAVLLLWIFYVFLSCVCYVFVRVCLYVPCGHLLGKGWPLGFSFMVSNCGFFYFPIGILGQLWYLIVSIPDICTLTYFHMKFEFNWPSGIWGNNVLMCQWDSIMSDLDWNVKGQPWPLKLIYSHCHIRLNISSENNDFGFNSIQKPTF